MIDTVILILGESLLAIKINLIMSLLRKKAVRKTVKPRAVPSCARVSILLQPRATTISNWGIQKFLPAWKI